MTASGKVRIGMVGAGFAASFHFECLRRVYGFDVEISGVTSLHAENRERFALEHNIKAYDNVEKMLEHIDVLDVCSPPYAHQEAITTAAQAAKGIICEKPLTGCFGPKDADERFYGNKAGKKEMLSELVARLESIAETVRSNNVFFGYAENYVYAPSIQKEREIIEKTGAQILRILGEESHSGSASPVYGIWRFAGGGSLIGKSCHPLGGALYLKQIEGLARKAKPIRPCTVSARTHEITRSPGYVDAGFIRTDYHDVEDYGIMHVVFDDGTVADIIASELVLGGLYDFVEVFGNNHRTRCRISPTNLVDTFNPREEQYKDIYVVEKINTKQGWSQAAPDENFTIGYQTEMQDFICCAVTGQRPQSGLELALDTTATIYAAYLSAENKGKEIEIPITW
ncbi:MAG: Gfo/Idh/MocA family oxidoreductase [Planctomycetota bacterium]